MKNIFSPLLHLGFQKVGVQTVNNTAPDTNGNVNVAGGGGSGTNEIIEWVTGGAKPTIEADITVGAFYEGKQHLLTTLAVGEETIAIIEKTGGYNPTSYWNSSWQNVRQAIRLQDDCMFITGYDNNGLYLKKINNNGIEDVTFTTTVISSFSVILLMAQLSDGSIILAGCTPTMTGCVKKISLTGIEDATFTANISGLFTGIIVDILILNGDNIIVANTDTHLRKISSAGVEDITFTANMSAIDLAGLYSSTKLKRLSDDRVVFSFGHSTYSCLKLISADGIEDTTFAANYVPLPALTAAILIDDENEIFIGGRFDGFVKKISTSGIEDTNYQHSVFNPVVSMCLVKNKEEIMVLTEMIGIVTANTVVDFSNIRILPHICCEALLSFGDYFLFSDGFSFKRYVIADYWLTELPPLNPVSVDDVVSQIIPIVDCIINEFRYVLRAPVGSIFFADGGGHLTYIDPPTLPSVLKHGGIGTFPFWETLA